MPIKLLPAHGAAHYLYQSKPGLETEATSKSKEYVKVPKELYYQLLGKNGIGKANSEKQNSSWGQGVIHGILLTGLVVATAYAIYQNRQFVSDQGMALARLGKIATKIATKGEQNGLTIWSPLQKPITQTVKQKFVNSAANYMKEKCGWNMWGLRDARLILCYTYSEVKDFLQNQN